MKNTFVISCPIDTYSGYGARSRDLVKSIIELDKYDVKILGQRWGSCSFGFVNDHPEWHFLRNHMIGGIDQKPDIWAQITVPNEFTPVGKYNIGFTAGIETTLCAAPWVEGMNRMDLNIVSSEHSKQVFLQSKYDKVDQKTNQKIGVISIEKPIEAKTNSAIFFPTEEEQFEEIKKKEKEEVNAFRKDIKDLSYYQWTKKYITGDTKK